MQIERLERLRIARKLYDKGQPGQPSLSDLWGLTGGE